MLRVLVSEVEINDRILAAAHFQLVRNGAGDDVTRSEFRERVVLGHEACELVIAQNSAFAAQRF